MGNIRERFTQNAEEFDALMTEMLAENECLRARVADQAHLIEEQNSAIALRDERLAELGGQEPVGVVDWSEEEGSFVDMYPELMPLPGTRLYTTPPPAPSVPDEVTETLKAAYQAIEAQPIDAFGTGYAETDGEPQPYPIRDELMNNIARAIKLTATPAPSMEEQCEDDLRKVMGMYPHNHPGNICHADPYFSKAIDRKYPAEMIERITDRLRS